MAFLHIGLHDSEKEYIKPYREWRQLVRTDSNKLVLMDNNILASDFGIAQLADMIGSGRFRCETWGEYRERVFVKKIM